MLECEMYLCVCYGPVAHTQTQTYMRIYVRASMFLWQSHVSSTAKKSLFLGAFAYSVK